MRRPYKRGASCGGRGICGGPGTGGPGERVPFSSSPPRRRECRLRRPGVAICPCAVGARHASPAGAPRRRAWNTRDRSPQHGPAAQGSRHRRTPAAPAPRIDMRGWGHRCRTPSAGPGGDLSRGARKRGRRREASRSAQTKCGAQPFGCAPSIWRRRPHRGTTPAEPPPGARLRTDAPASPATGARHWGHGGLVHPRARRSLAALGMTAYERSLRFAQDDTTGSSPNPTSTIRPSRAIVVSGKIARACDASSGASRL